MTAELKKCLRQAMKDELRVAAREFTLRGIQIRVVKRVLDIFKMSKKDLRFVLDHDVFFVHPQVSAYLYEKFPIGSFVDEQKEEVLRRFFSSDYHWKRDLLDYADLLDGEVLDRERRHWLNLAFGVDGFRGEKLRNYVDNLGREMRDVTMAETDWEEEDKGPVTEHVKVVRTLHEKLGPLKPELVRMGIQCALDGTDSSSLNVNKVAKMYEKHQGPRNMERAKSYIDSNYVCFDGEKMTETNI